MDGVLTARLFDRNVPCEGHHTVVAVCVTCCDRVALGPLNRHETRDVKTRWHRLVGVTVQYHSPHAKLFARPIERFVRADVRQIAVQPAERLGRGQAVLARIVLDIFARVGLPYAGACNDHGERREREHEESHTRHGLISSNRGIE